MTGSYLSLSPLSSHWFHSSLSSMVSEAENATKRASLFTCIMVSYSRGNMGGGIAYLSIRCCAAYTVRLRRCRVAAFSVRDFLCECGISNYCNTLAGMKLVELTTPKTIHEKVQVRQNFFIRDLFHSTAELSAIRCTGSFLQHCSRCHTWHGARKSKNS